MVSELMEETVLHNNEIYNKLCGIVTEHFLSGSSVNGDVRFGQLEINDFSICFGIDVNIESGGESGSKGLYVKIPKANMFLKEQSNRTILPLTDADRKFGEAEYNSLVYISKAWQSDDLNISFVKPLGFIKDYNAIVTRRIFAGDIFKVFRKDDLLGRLHIDNHNNRMHDSLFRIGKALARFHNNSLTDGVFTTMEAQRKIELYCSRLRTFGINSNFLNNIVTGIRKLRNYMCATHLTKTLKGLDIRNILTDNSGHVYILDPGTLKEDYREMDLARFIVTCRILYWGGLFFFLRLCPAQSYEDSFLKGYYDSNEKVSKILIVLIIKELLKHWCMAYTVLQLKPWPKILKNFLRYAYIDPFYKGQINSEFINLARYK